MQIPVQIHPCALERISERGTTVEEGQRVPAKFGRVGFKLDFTFNAEWRGRLYGTKQIEAIAVDENGWLVLTVIVRYF